MDDILIVLAAWFILGAISALWIYYDLKKTRERSWQWVALGFLLSLVGLAVYYFVGRKKTSVSNSPEEEYLKPEYKFEGEGEKKPEAPKQPVEVKVKKKEKKQMEQLEGCPRCPQCGAAISIHEQKCWDCGAQLVPD